MTVKVATPGEAPRSRMGPVTDMLTGSSGVMAIMAVGSRTVNGKALSTAAAVQAVGKRKAAVKVVDGSGKRRKVSGASRMATVGSSPSKSRQVRRSKQHKVIGRRRMSGRKMIGAAGRRVATSSGPLPPPIKRRGPAPIGTRRAGLTANRKRQARPGSQVGMPTNPGTLPRVSHKKQRRREPHKEPRKRWSARRRGSRQREALHRNRRSRPCRTQLHLPCG
mmetsp:Transcript_60819/g.144928  ORF Transcript_60819/g.144928 Transcript_60819/m.144928 type:complete len:221 (-) Transcript_60819:634-1296(-)